MKKTTKILALMLALLLGLCSCSSASAFSKGLDDRGYIKDLNALDYVDITGDIDNITISQDEIDYQISYLTGNVFPEEVPLEEKRAIIETDSVNIDYVGSVDGVPFDGGDTQGKGTTVNISTTSYIDGFLEQLVGHKAGDVFDINVKFPDDYQKDSDGNVSELAGKDAVFHITINYIASYKPAEFNDDFVTKNLTYSMYQYTGLYITTAEDYKNYLKQAIIQDAVLGNISFKEDTEVPADVQATVNNMVIMSIQQYAESQQGVELVKYLKDQYGVSSKEEYLEQNASELEQEAKDIIVLQALAEHYGVSVSEDTLKEYFSGEEEGSLTYKEALKTFGVGYLKYYFLQDEIWNHVETLTTVE